MKNDEESRIWVTNWLNQQDWIVTATTFSAECGGADIVYTTSAGTVPCELKTQRKTSDECWDFETVNFSWFNTPKRTDTNATFKNLMTGNSMYDLLIPKGEMPVEFSGKTFFIFNADGGNDGAFMVEHDNQNYDCKWLKILKQKQSLIILYKDGAYIMDNKKIRKQFLGYVRYLEKEWTNKSGFYKIKNNPLRYGIKAAIELREEDFIPINDIPRKLFNKN